MIDDMHKRAQRQQKKKNMLAVFSFAIYNSIIKEKQQLHSIRLETKNKKRRKKMVLKRENIIINQR
jgi:hypothetical protein